MYEEIITDLWKSMSVGSPVFTQVWPMAVDFLLTSKIRCLPSVSKLPCLWTCHTGGPQWASMWRRSTTNAGTLHVRHRRLILRCWMCGIEYWWYLKDILIVFRVIWKKKQNEEAICVPIFRHALDNLNGVWNNCTYYPVFSIYHIENTESRLFLSLTLL
jgi:hypothetical protein